MQWLLALLIGLFTLNCAAQTTPEVNVRDAELVGLYNKFKENRHHYESDDGENRDVLLNRFTNALLQTLTNKQYTAASFDSLAEVITIVSSQDNNLRLFSWNEFSGGTWHIYRTAFQYKAGEQLLAGLLPVDESRYAEAIHFNILDRPNDTYLVKAYGTHGSGQDYFLYRLLSIKNETISDCSQCFNNNDMFIFEKMRGFKSEPSYDSITNTISYPELKPDIKDGEDTGFTKPSGNVLQLHYVDGRFIKLND